jgi:hypothetical protein
LKDQDLLAADVLGRKQAEQGQCNSREINADQSIAKRVPVFGATTACPIGRPGLWHATSIYSRSLCLISPQIPCQSLSAHSPRPTGGLMSGPPCFAKQFLTFYTLTTGNTLEHGHGARLTSSFAQKASSLHRQATFAIMNMLHKTISFHFKLPICFNLI